MLRLSGADASVKPGDPVQNAQGKDAGNVLLSVPPICLAVIRQPADPEYRTGSLTLTAEA